MVRAGCRNTFTISVLYTFKPAYHREAQLLPHQQAAACAGALRDDDDVDEPTFSWEIVHKGSKEAFGRKANHLTAQSGFIVAVRRNLGNISAASFGCCVLTDISRQIVVKSEVISGASQIAAFRFFS